MKIFFANDDESVAATDNTYDLIAKLKSEDPSNILIVSSIQKMSRIKEGNYKNKDKDIEAINKKRMVIIIDECHRSVFGEMLQDIVDTFPDAMFFGFTGTPIFEENQKKDNTTNTVFGDELHRYSIANGITDKNVLGFDPIRAETYKAKDLREEIAFDACHTRDLNEISNDDKLKDTYQYYTTKCPMVSVTDSVSGKIIEKGIEDFLPDSQYERDEHRKMVVENILENWMTLSNFSLFHAIFATSSIPEAIEYYRLFKSKMAEDNTLPQLKITALFDPSENHNAGDIFKSQGVTEILIDYNNRYFGIPDKYKKETYSDFKKDVSYRLAHKEAYKFIDNQKDKQIDILIVVDQMLTGFDSKWINTLYVDKMMEFEKIIQSFSRTNRLYGKEKPHGIIKYYRRPFTMEKRIEKAFDLYSGNKPFGIFVCKLKENIDEMNQCFKEIQGIFANAGYPNFDKLPADENDCAMFAKQFIQMNRYIESAKVQGYRLDIQDYDFEVTDGKRAKCHVDFTEHQYNALLLRYKELIGGSGGGAGGGSNPYPVDGYITEINTGEINANYMNSKFKQFVKVLAGSDSASIQAALDELHNTFGELTSDEQKYARQFLNDVQQGYVKIDDSKSFKDYIAEYERNAKNTQLHKFAIAIGMDENELSIFMKYNITDQNINEFNKFDILKSHVDRSVAKAYFERIEGKTVSMLQVNAKVDSILRKFILSGGFDL